MKENKDLINIRLVSPRLVLRRIREDDKLSLYELAKDPRVGPNAGWKPHGSLRETEDVITNIFLENDTFVIGSGKSDLVMGIISIERDRYRPDAESGELGYWLGHNYWGKGFMTEAAGAVIKYGFEVKGLKMMGICTSPVNARSQSVIRKCGFTYEGTIRKTFKIYDGSLRDSQIYSMTLEEYKKNLLSHSQVYEGVELLQP